MRSFAFGASLIVPMTNRSEIFEREEPFFGESDSRFNMTSFELRKDFMDLTSHWTQKIDFHDGVRSSTVYEAQWWYAVAAVLISIISSFSLASLFWGWWELGRDVSLNPLEIALAFDSSMFENVNSNSRRSQIVRVVGRQKVIYSVVEAVKKKKEGERNEEARDRNEGAGEEAEEENTHLHLSSQEDTLFDRRSLGLRLKFNHVDESLEPEDGEVSATMTSPRPGDGFR